MKRETWSARGHWPRRGSKPVGAPATRCTPVLAEVLEHLARGEAVSVVAVDSEVTTQQAADLLNVSRPFLVELVERGEIEHRKVGPRRRLRLVDVLAYKEIDDARRRAAADELSAEAQRLGLDY